MAPPPELNTDVVSEILLHLQPDNPAGLVRASAVCKLWLQTVTDSHGTPSVLGFLHNRICCSCFVPTTAFRPHAAATTHRSRTAYVLDCRHGRVLLRDSRSSEFVVWDPVTGRERRIPDEDTDYTYTNYAVLCAAGASCGHSTCSGGPFILACAGVQSSNCGLYSACFYSSETGVWSAQTTLSLQCYCGLEDRPATFVADALYFDGTYSGILVRYDVLGRRRLSMMELPLCDYDRAIVMTTDNGGLGLATFDNDDMLVLWSAETGRRRSRDDARWSQLKLIDLQKLLPIDIDMNAAWLSGFAEDANVIFLGTYGDGIFAIDLKSLLARKVSEMGNVGHVFPYVSFYTPAALATGTLQSPVETL